MPADSSRAVFLSYAREDTEAARRMAEALRGLGVEVWFDQNELVGGDAWDAKIRREIKECALFVPVISAKTQARLEGYFRLEWKLAVDRSHLMADDAPFIVPAVIDDTPESAARVPERFLERQWTHVGPDPTAFAKRVCGLLASRAAAVAPVVPVARTPRSRRGPLLIAVALVAVALAAGVWFFQRNAAIRWAHDTALPEIARLVQNDQIAEAFALATRVEQIIPRDPALAQWWPKIAVNVSLTSEPPGVEVQVKPYAKPEAAWRSLGITPVSEVRLPVGFYRWRFSKEGYAAMERAGPAGQKSEVSLSRADVVPAGMVRVEGSARLNLAALEHLPTVRLPEFFIDRYEVTNRQFKAFVERGGYTNPAYWRQPFIDNGRELSRAEAMARFVDRTGRAGPATWKEGSYGEGEAERPVTGVSWFEAAAFAESVAKRLPSIYHWSRAGSGVFAQYIVPLSNFSNRELAPVGTFQGMSSSGTYDMAGNAKEWCFNAASADRRYILGGGWRDPEYQFTYPDAQSPFDRGPANGFRCIALAPGTALAPAVDQPVQREIRDYAVEKPASDELFAVYRSLYAYDRTPLDARIESEDDSDRRWLKTKVTFDAAYGGERVIAFVYRPRDFPPPYQTVVYFPGSGALTQRSNDRTERSDLIALLVASGRAVVYPIYKSTYERGDGMTSSVPDMTNGYRDHVVHWSNDLGRTIDYLETRKDIDPDKLAFMGQSWGARLASILVAVEPRFKVAVLCSGGLRGQSVQPPADELNFVSRVKIPTLMVNGRYDFTFPVETAQLPMFRLLGTPAEHKRHVLYDFPHGVPTHIQAKEAIDWLDRYLGVVK